MILKVIKTKNISKRYERSIKDFSKNWDGNYLSIRDYLQKNYKIDCSIDQDIISSFSRDWSNLPGFADILLRPKNDVECSISLKLCYQCKISITISAGKTNLTGSATPFGGAILSTSLLTSPSININHNKKEVLCPVGIPLEVMRNEILHQSRNKLYYPVDPTSRNDAFVGGTVLCNASGFIPGEKGATRFWVKELHFLLPNGNLIRAKRGKHISKNGIFVIEDEERTIKIPIPKYKRPKIKNASGPYTCFKGEIDLVDFIVGSEGIYGLVTICVFELATKPNEHLELFICLENEKKAISFHDYLLDYFKGDMSKVTALEYFGYNSQNYMKHRNFLFKNTSEVGIYLQIPIYKGSLENMVQKWINILSDFDSKIDIENIIVLNDPLNWKKFFEARHSIPDNALTKTKQLGGISIITDTIVPPKNFSKYLDKVHDKLQSNNIEYLLFGHLGDCHLHFHLIPSNKQDKKCLEIYNYLIDLSSELGGVYSAEHGTGKRKRNDFRKCYGNKAVEMVKKAKLAIDPHLILNKGNIFND